MPAWLALKPALGLLGRFWWAIPILGLAVALFITRGTLERRTEALEAERTARIELVQKYRDTAQLALSWVTERNAVIEKNQALVSVEVVNEYRQSRDDLRARYNALLLRRQQAGTNSGGAGASTAAGVPNAPGRVDGAAAAAELHPIEITPEQALLAEEIRLQLIGLQSWVRGQAAVPR